VIKFIRQVQDHSSKPVATPQAGMPPLPATYRPRCTAGLPDL